MTHAVAKTPEYKSVNPFDNKLTKSFEEITDKQLEEKIATATACFAAWKKTSYAERAAIVNKAAKLLHEQADHFARIMTSEMGKRISEAKGEVEFSSEILTYYAENAQRFLADVPLHPSHGVGHMESSPIGVIFITIRGSFVGTRQDMAETLAFAADGQVKADIELQPLSAINRIFDRLEHGDVPSRVVLDYAAG